jgi:hypothetical protein
MVDEPFILPEIANRLTSSERGLILVVIEQLLAKRQGNKKPTAPVYSLRKYKNMKEEGEL